MIFRNIASNYFGLIILVFLVATFWHFNASLPFVMDDALYAHIYPVEQIDNGQPHCLDVSNKIQTFSDVMESQWNHYFTKNGRGLTHVIVQSFCGILGKPLYNVCAAIMFAAFILLLGKIFGPWHDVESLRQGRFILPLLLFFILIPEPTCLWNGIAYGVNYLWSSVWCLLLIYIIMYKEAQPLWILPLGLLVAVLAGWSHEGLVIPLGASFLWYVCQNYFRLNKKQWLLLCLFVAAASLLVFAPSNFNRAGSMNNAEWAGGSLALRLRAFGFVRGLYVFIVACVVLLCYNRGKFIAFVKDNQCWIFGWMISISFILLVGALNERSTYSIDFFSILLLCRILPYFDYINQKSKLLSCVSAMIIITGACFVSYWQYKAGEQYRSIDALLEKSESEDAMAVVEPVEIPHMFSRYVAHYKFDQPWEDWEERVARFKFDKRQVLIVDSKNPQRVTNLMSIMDETHKYPGNNPFYKVGNYLISLEPLGDKVHMKWFLGDYNAYDIRSFAKKCVSIVKKPVSNEMIVEPPVIHKVFQGHNIWIVEIYPKQGRKITSITKL